MNDCEREDCLHFIPESEMRSASESITCFKFPTALNNKVYNENFAAWFGSCQKVIESSNDSYLLLLELSLI